MVSTRLLQNNSHHGKQEDKEKLTAITRLLLGISLLCIPLLASAVDSTQAGPIGSNPMQQQPTTTTPQATVTIKPSSGGKLECKEGYVLTSINSTKQDNVKISVCSECNGIAAFGYAHTWCRNNCADYKAVTSAPTNEYICKKIENKWVPLH
jgi:hypothetical protein